MAERSSRFPWNCASEASKMVNASRRSTALLRRFYAKRIANWLGEGRLKNADHLALEPFLITHCYGFREQFDHRSIDFRKLPTTILHRLIVTAQFYRFYWRKISRTLYLSVVMVIMCEEVSTLLYSCHIDLFCWNLFFLQFVMGTPAFQWPWQKAWTSN